MIRLMEITGLTLSDIREITGFVMSVLIACVFVGNVFSWSLKWLLDFVDTLIVELLDFIKKHISDKRAKRKK